MNTTHQTSKNMANLSTFIRTAKKLRTGFAKEKVQPKKVAVLSNFTLKGLPECLIVKSFSAGISVETYEGAYGQWRQEILGSGIYDFKPDIVFIILDAFGMDTDEYYLYHSFKEGALASLVKNFTDELVQMISALKKRSNAKIVVGTIPNHWHQMLGVADTKFAGNLRRAVSRANVAIEDMYAGDKQVFVFDFDGWLGYIGKETHWNGKFFFLGDMKLNPDAVPLLAEEFVSYLVPLALKSKKCIVLDLDNTLWGGIVGEDGINGIALGPHGTGRPFYLFQKLLLGLYHRGIILAVNSKNNLKDATEIFKKHPHAVLKEEHFAAMRVNWHDKVANLKELAEEINIGLDGMIFVDDDSANRAMVREMLPEVAVLDLPRDPADYGVALMAYPGLNHLDFTREDRRRGAMYQEEKKRKELERKTPNLKSFLNGLKLKICIEEISDASLSRAAQLTQKTNQFNLTMRRYQEEEIKKMLKMGVFARTLSAADRFGDYGITGLALARDRKNHWEIDTFLLSCRILGKGIEEQFLGSVLAELKKIKPMPVRGIYIPTAKNTQTEDFYRKMRFKRISHSSDRDILQLDLKKYAFAKLNRVKLTHNFI